MKGSTKSPWKRFDFGPEKNSHVKASRSECPDISIVNLEVTKTDYPKKSSLDYYSELAPKNVSDLAVHPKKIEEVQSWLERVFSNQNYSNTTSFLLISGPTGSGKSTVLNVLCKNLDISICEWVNPIDQDFELVRGPNQVTRFLEFITTESNYTSLFDISSAKRIVLVEDFPNVFLKNPEEFSNILEDCYYKSKYPIVFICADIANKKINLAYNLFPQEILIKYKITQISFNACAPTMLRSALKRAHDLVSKNRDIFQTPSSNVVDAILSSSMGDIRCAVNQYYFASLLGSKNMPTEKASTIKSGSKRKRSEKSSTIRIMAKDETLGLFHALGRILNPKRKDHKESWRLNCDLESLITELETQPESVVSFLFANYIKYFGDFEDLQQASELLCASQKFFDKWSESKDLHQYPLWISVLGLMVVNKHKVSRWNQIEGPKKMKKAILKNLEDDYYIDIITKRNTKKF